MSKENFLFGIIGLLFGAIIGFMSANSINRNAATPATANPSADNSQMMSENSNMPPGHPDISGSNALPSLGEITPEIQAAIDKAKSEPDNFDAQLKAAEFYYQIQQLDNSIEYLTRANKLKPESYEVIVHLGNANFDSNKFEEAEKWYVSALGKKQDDVGVRTDLGLTYIFRETPNYDRAIEEFNKSLGFDPNHIQTLQNLTVAYIKKKDAENATKTLSKLEAADAKNTAVSKLREDIKNIGKTP